jgi:P-type Ca2+ transporter type 2C
LLPRSRSPSRSPAASNADLPQTPSNNEQAVGDSVAATPQTPEKGPKTRRRARSSSNSAFGPAAAMAGIVAGSIAGGWSPLERRSEEQETVRFTRSRSASGVEGVAGMEVHPDTRVEDPVFAENFQRTKVPPSQRADLTPHFDHAPPPTPEIHIGRKSHSRQSSSQV